MERKIGKAGIMMALLLISILMLASNLTIAEPNGSNKTELVGSTDAATTQNTEQWPMFLHDLNHTGYSNTIGPKTNQTRWTYRTGNSIFSPPAVADGMVFIGSADNKVYALNKTTGASIWNYTTGGKVYSGFAVANGIVYTGSWDCKVYALNETTGTLIWNYTTGNIILASSPAVANGVVYIGSNDFKLYALDAQTGTHIWNFTTSGKIWSSPAVVGGIVYVGSYANWNSVSALNATTGSLIWQYNAGLVYYSSPVVSENVVYIGTSMQSYSKVYALNALTGSSIWNFSVGDYILGSPAVAYGMVYIGSYDYNLYALNKTSGSLVWKYYIGTDIVPSPAVADGIVYIGDSPPNFVRPATIYAVNATTGDLIWSFITTGVPSSYFQSSAAIVDGMLFVGCVDFKVYALGEIHDVAITDVTPSKTVVGTGYSMSVNVTEANQGNYSETFNVTAYANETVIATFTDTTLPSGVSTTLTFTWNTSSFAKGNYTMSAYAEPVQGETDTSDNNLTGGWVKITIVGDVNGDGKVNLIDVFSVALAYGSSPGDPKWNPNYDINDDGKINLQDYFTTALNYGKTDT